MQNLYSARILVLYRSILVHWYKVWTRFITKADFYKYQLGSYQKHISLPIMKLFLLFCLLFAVIFPARWTETSCNVHMLHKHLTFLFRHLQIECFSNFQMISSIYLPCTHTTLINMPFGTRIPPIPYLTRSYLCNCFDLWSQFYGQGILQFGMHVHLFKPSINICVNMFILQKDTCSVMGLFAK